MMLGEFQGQPTVGSLLLATSATIAVTALGAACGTSANPPPIATAVPPAAVAPAPTLAAPPATAPAAEVAPAQAPASVFVFPPTRTPRPTATPIPRAEGDMTQAVLYNHTATLLEDGRVLVTGGQTAGSGTWPPPRPPPTGVVSAEIYDPSTDRWSPTAPMTEPRRWHGAVLLEDGEVLVSGGLQMSMRLPRPMRRSPGRDPSPPRRYTIRPPRPGHSPATCPTRRSFSPPGKSTDPLYC